MIAETLVPAFLFGIANSAHCAGMCGVFAAQAASSCESGRGAARMGLYLTGKTFTYVFLGALAGFLGGQVLRVTSDAQIGLGIGAGLLLVLAGVAVLRTGRATSRFGVWWASLLGPFVASVRRAHVVGGPFALGAVTGFLPCGVVYLAALQGAATACPIEGSLVMASFGLGTVPVLLAVGLAGRGLLSRFGANRMRLAGGFLIVLTGLFTIGRAVLPLVAGDGSGGPACCH